MPLTVEDGSGVAGADSYISITDADTYFGARGNPSQWTSLGMEEKEAFLRVAATFEDGAYQWKGHRKTTMQGLDWPREEVVDDEGDAVADDVVPRNVIYAQAELGLLFALGTISSSSSSSTQAGGVKAVQVGSVRQEFFEAGSRSGHTIINQDTDLHFVNLLLRPYIVIQTDDSDISGDGDTDYTLGDGRILPVSR